MPAVQSPSPALRLENSYARLPERFFARLAPIPVNEPQLIRLNHQLASLLKLDPEMLSSPAGVDVLAGNQVPEGSEPLAMAYAGHQFGNFVPQLGDGRAILLGDVLDGDGQRRDIQLKGSGRTPFSGIGDGRAWIGPVLREYVVSEAMHALGVPTTRSLAAVTTGEMIWRETVLPGAVLTRVARSLVRVGTFQYFAARRDVEAMQLLADHVIARIYPQCSEAEKPYRAFLDAVVAGQAGLVAQWMRVGFIHGVMNTDNMSVAGETIDYGPCAFMDAYHPETVFSSIDRTGRYAYTNQPYIAHWNLACLAQALLPLLGADDDAAVAEAQSAVDAFPDQFRDARRTVMRSKIGLVKENDGDDELLQDLLDRMKDNRADFTLTFRALCDGAVSDPDLPIEADEPIRSCFADPLAFDVWVKKWRQRLRLEEGDDTSRRAAMRQVNPAFIPRNHRIEAVINAAVETSDFQPFHELVSVLENPYDDQPEFAAYTNAPEQAEIVHRTFCGT